MEPRLFLVAPERALARAILAGMRGCPHLLLPSHHAADGAPETRQHLPELGDRGPCLQRRWPAGWFSGARVPLQPRSRHGGLFDLAGAEGLEQAGQILEGSFSDGSTPMFLDFSRCTRLSTWISRILQIFAEFEIS